MIIDHPQPGGRSFQFSLAKFFVFLTSLCACLALWVCPAKKQGDTVAAIEALGGWVGYGERHQELTEAESLLFSIGKDYFGTVQSVSFHNRKVADADLQNLKGLTSLQYLYLDGTNVSGPGLVHLKALMDLKYLDLANSDVTGPGLEHLQGLAKLEHLRLNDTKITDAGLEHLKGMASLHILVLRDTQTTEKGAEQLQKALPNCSVVW